MRISPYPLLLAALLAPGCPAPGGDTTSATAATTDASTSTSTTGATTSATSGLTSGTGTSTTGDGSSSAAATDPSTSAATTATSSTGDATTSGSSGTAGTSGGPTPTQACVTNDDCKLHDDCCTCAGVPADEPVVDCPQQCKQSKCSEVGVDQAVCRLGVCTTERLSCDANKVLCDSLPPPCPPGSLAETSPACWTGKCVPAEYCDVVPECGLCPDGTMCVTDIAFGPQGWSRCEPIPPACEGQVTCDCVGDLVCIDMFTACSVQGGAVFCECPNC